ncbi:MAG: TolC family protein, partial [Gammaproteobacteria bacterium]
MIKKLVQLLTFCGALLATTNSFAIGLMEIYREAVVKDPVLQQAYYTKLATEQVLPQARSDLLPYLSGIADLSREYLRQSLEQFNGITGLSEPTARFKGTYNDALYQVDLRQPVFNYAAWKNVQSAKATVKQAEAEFNDAAQDLMIRVATDYFAVLEAQDILRFTQAERRASGRSLEEATERYNVGLEAITAVYEAQAEYDRNTALEIENENEVANSKEAIRLLVGRTYDHFSSLREEIPLIPPTPNNAKKWEESAGDQNYQVLASRFALESA